MFMFDDIACPFCRWPFDDDDCTKRGEGVGSAEPVGCRDFLGVRVDRAGVDDTELRDEWPRFREEVGDDIVYFGDSLQETVLS